jgi:membrane dipeptidase
VREVRRNLRQSEIDLLEKIYDETLVIDAHSDTIWVKSLEEWGKKPDFLQADITKLKSGGIDVEFYAISGNFASIGDHLVKNTAYTLWVFDKLYQEISTFVKDVKLAKNSEDIISAKKEDKLSIICAIEHKDIISAKKEDKLSIICAIEHSLCLQGEIGILRMFHRLGLRCLQPTTHRRTWMGDGVGERSGGKLTNFGVEVVEEAHRLGMLIDAAHLSENCYWDLIDLTEDPIIISHANAKSVCDHIRNFDDKQLQALSARALWRCHRRNFCPGIY